MQPAAAKKLAELQELTRRQAELVAAILQDCDGGGGRAEPDEVRQSLDSALSEEQKPVDDGQGGCTAAPAAVAEAEEAEGESNLHQVLRRCSTRAAVSAVAAAPESTAAAATRSKAPPPRSPRTPPPRAASRAFSIASSPNSSARLLPPAPATPYRCTLCARRLLSCACCLLAAPWTVWSLTLGQRRAEVLVPHSTPHELWRLLVMLGVAFVAVVVPLEIAFDDHFHPKLPWAVANVGFDVLFLVEVYIAMRTGYYLDGMVVLEPAAVRSHYLHTRFALDLFVAAPFAWFVGGDTFDEDSDYHSGTPAIVRVLRLLRLGRVVPKLIRNDLAKIRPSTSWLHSHVSLPLERRFGHAAGRVAQLSALLLIACHWSGCLWWLVGTTGCNIFDDDPAACDDGWGPSSELQAAGLRDKYAVAFLWGASLMTCLVPFDVEPTTTGQVEAQPRGGREAAEMPAEFSSGARHALATP